MFEEVSGTRPSPESIARLDDLFERRHPSTTPRSAALVEQICAMTRVENRAAAAQLTAIGDLFGYRLSRCSETEDWAIDTEEAVTAEVAAALRISQALAGSRLRYARAMREQLPQVGAVFQAGDIDYRTFQTIVYRTELITDRDVLAAVDAKLAANVARWPSMTRGRLAAQIDKIVAQADADAVRRRQQHQADRAVWFGDLAEGGISEMHGSLLSVDAHAVDKRLDALAATVCEHDPRSRDQRRADALGALAAGADRLACRCARPDCAAGSRPAATPVVIHVMAEQATIAGSGATPGSLVGADGLIPPELVAELAKSTALVPLVHPSDAPPEPGYAPSRALADFVRCRDLTCRWPGCDHPAYDCDLDHTIPHADGGPTHASNLKCYCRTHRVHTPLRRCHREETPFTGHVPQLVRAAILELQPRPDHKVAQGAGHEHLVRSCQGAHPRPDMHTDPADVIAAHFALAGLQPGAHFDAQRLHCVTDRHRAADRSLRTVEHREETVARRVHFG